MTAPEQDPKAFDLDSFLGQFTPANWTARIPTRGDILIQIEDLREQIGMLDEAIDPIEKALKRDADDDEAVGDSGSKTKIKAELNRLNADRDKLIVEHNKLVDQFEKENVQFTFRPVELTDHVQARKAFVDDGGDLNAKGSAEALLPYQWAQQCIDPPGVTAEAFKALRHRVGDPAMQILHRSWMKAANGGELIEAPFSPRSLPTPTTAKRSKG